MPWISNEAAALKTKLSGLTVTDVASTNRQIKVWFRNPEYELRDLTFPCIILEHSGISRASEREHRGTTTLPYVPEQYNVDGTAQTIDPTTGATITWNPTTDYDPNLSPFHVFDYPIPYNVDFMITVLSRFQTELTPLIAQLAVIDRLPERFGYLEIPQDGTVRTMDLLAGPEIVAEKDAEGKRVFRAVYSVRVVSELNLYDIQSINNAISTVSLNLHEIAFSANA